MKTVDLRSITQLFFLDGEPFFAAFDGDHAARLANLLIEAGLADRITVSDAELGGFRFGEGGPS